MVDGTFAQQTRAALHRLPDHSRTAAGGTGRDIVGGAENRDRRNAQRGRDMHGARIVGEKQFALAGQDDELRERRLAGMIHDVVTC